MARSNGFGVGFIFTWQWRGKDAAMEELAVYAAFGIVAVIAVGVLSFPAPNTIPVPPYP